MTQTLNFASAVSKLSEATPETSFAEVAEIHSDWIGVSMATLMDATEGDDAAHQKVHDGLFLSLREEFGAEMGLTTYCMMTNTLDHREQMGAYYVKRLGL